MTTIEIRREEARKLNAIHRRKLWIKMYKKEYFSNGNTTSERKREFAVTVANDAVDAFNKKFKQKKDAVDITNEEGEKTTINAPTSHVDVH